MGSTGWLEQVVESIKYSQGKARVHTRIRAFCLYLPKVFLINGDLRKVFSKTLMDSTSSNLRKVFRLNGDLRKVCPKPCSMESIGIAHST